MGTASALDADAQAILEFERGWWRAAVPKERAIRDRFGISPARYYQRLNRLIDRPEALAFDPMLVRRLRRLRDARREVRFAGRLDLQG
jgi:Protein of unknown function (DUF3263)